MAADSASTGYDLVIVEFLLMAVACFFLLRYYAASMVSVDVLLTVYLSWILGLMGVLLLPYDLSIAIVYDQRSSSLLDVWTFVYWSTLFFAWVMLPMQMGFHTSGHFTFREKLWDSLYKLLLTAVVAIVLGIVYIIYMLASSGGSLNSIIGFVMAMGNTYGVLLITLLMGNGLVAVPRQLWRMGDTSKELLDIYISASYIEEAYIEACYELEDCEVEVKQVVQVVTMRLSPRHTEQLDMESGKQSRTAPVQSSIQHIDEINRSVSVLNNKVDEFKLESRNRIAGANRGAAAAPSTDSFDELTNKDKLVTLHAKLMNAQMKARSCEKRWLDLIERSDRCIQSVERRKRISQQNRELSDTETLADGRGAPIWSILPNPDGSIPVPSAIDTESMSHSSSSFSYFQQKVSTFTQYILFYISSLYGIWRIRFFSHSCRAAAVVCGVASILILWCELVMSSNLDSPIGLMMTAYTYQQSDPVMIQAVSFLFLAYMSICTYWPLFQLNIGFSYQLQGPQLSSPSSLIFNGQYLSRLQFALGYNFLGAINVSRADKAAFRELLKSMELVPVFGTSFTVYVPLVLVIVAMLTYFNGYERILQLVGVEYELTVPAETNSFCGNGNKSGLTEAINSCSADNDAPNSGAQQQRHDEVDVSSINDPEVLEKVRTGKRIISGELKRLRSANGEINRGLSSSSQEVGKYRSKYGKLSGADADKTHEIVLNPLQSSSALNSHKKIAGSVNESTLSSSERHAYSGRYSDVPLDDSTRYSNPVAAQQRDVFSILGDDDDDDDDDEICAGNSSATKSGLFTGRYANL